uniref:Uncharacterized protein n=1 Tax=Megaselia scalaris TaxID=36166 RepID=T1GF53_MEGSC
MFSSPKVPSPCVTLSISKRRRLRKKAAKIRKELEEKVKAEEQKKNTTMKPEIMQTATTDKSREQIKAEREAKKAAKQAAKTKSKEKSGENTVPATTNLNLLQKLNQKLQSL